MRSFSSLVAAAAFALCALGSFGPAQALVQASSPSPQATERPKVTVTIQKAPASEARLARLLEQVQLKILAKDWAGLASLMPELRREFRAAPETYPLVEQVSAETFLVRGGMEDLISLIPASLAMAAHQGLTGYEVQMRPNTYGGLALSLGFEAVERGDIEEALSVLNKGLAMQPGNPRLIKQKAAALQVAARHEEALAFLDEVLAQNLVTVILQSAPLHRARGFSLIELDRLPEARQAYQKALDEDGADQMALNQMKYIDELAAGGPKRVGQLTRQVQASNP